MLIPVDVAGLQSLLNIKISAAEVNEDEVEVNVSGDSEQLFSDGYEMLHPATLVFH